jgi:hypothetical protein
VGSDASNASSLPSFSFAVCGGTGEQYAAYTVLYGPASRRTAVKRLAGGQWVDAGRPRFTTAQGSRMGLACFADGDPLLALSDAAGRFAGSVYRLPTPGGAWATLGPPGFFTSLWDVATVVDAQGRALVAFANSAKQYRAAVMRYDGARWAYAGAGGDAISAAFADSLQLVLGPAGAPAGVRGVPFLSFMDFGTNSAAVRKLSGAGWAPVGGATPMTNGQLPRIAFSANGTLFIAHLVHPAVPVRLMAVRRYDPAADAWPRLGSNDPAPGGFVTALDLAVDAAGVPCVAYNDGGAGNKVGEWGAHRPRAAALLISGRTRPLCSRARGSTPGHTAVAGWAAGQRPLRGPASPRPSSSSCFPHLTTDAPPLLSGLPHVLPRLHRQLGLPGAPLLLQIRRRLCHPRLPPPVQHAVSSCRAASHAAAHRVQGACACLCPRLPAHLLAAAWSRRAAFRFWLWAQLPHCQSALPTPHTPPPTHPTPRLPLQRGVVPCGRVDVVAAAAGHAPRRLRQPRVTGQAPSAV